MESVKADLATGHAITSKTVFDMASNSKQFTADAVLLLAGRHRLALDDPLSEFLDDPPVWTRDVTLGDLMRHTSGITDYQDLLEAKGVELTDPAGQKGAIEAILASRPEDPPGKRFSYSNSNYVLLAHVATGEFVRWADNYRTGRIGGTELLTGVTEGVVDVGDVLRKRGVEQGRYGAGILLLPDESLVHRGDREGFHSTFKVSPDRDTAVTVACNADSPDNFHAADQLMDIWDK
ncbi:serine hydrolase domain-containing protein [Streptomyces sp. NPDC048337]|uniref:serine hydrolase domain-containing protein n=1 Tax=Streptomyces sp. NPDC048337 TaxID=3365535 RepID=UPI00371125A8